MTEAVALTSANCMLSRHVAAGAARSAIRQVPGWGFLPDTGSLASTTVDTRVLMGHRQVTDLHLTGLAAAQGTRRATFDAGLRDALVPTDRPLVEVWSG